MPVNRPLTSHQVCIAWLIALTTFFVPSARSALIVDVIGLSALQATTNLDGSGIVIADAESEVTAGSNDWEVTPTNSQINLPPGEFTWYDTPIPETNFPNGIGTDSWHSDTVGGFFYGFPGGVSTNVAHIENIEATYYFYTAVPSQTPFAARVVNQSFVTSKSDQIASDTAYDNYAARYGTLFVSGVGNGVYNNMPDPTVLAPSTAYNGIGVAAYGGASSVGPTIDNGRAKPDLTAPAGVTSYSTPLVAGSAVLLLRAAVRGDGGSDTNSAADIRTLKALLLNGAVKPLDWSAPSPSPLDPRYGAGVLNVFNSYHQMLGGKQTFQATTSVITNTPHPPTPPPGTIHVPSGWDFNSVASTFTTDEIRHYYIALTNLSLNASYAATITLVWNRQQNQTDINNLDLFLYNTANSNLVAASTSVVDNVEHIYVPKLAPGIYDMQVLKRGGNVVTPSENYALAFEFAAATLTTTPVAGGVKFSWPVYPARFVLQSNSSLGLPANWVNSPLPTITNGVNTVIISPAPTQATYYRLLRTPD